MATVTTKTINVELTYGDYTTRTYKIPVDGEGDIFTPAKTQIRAFNTAAADPTSSVYQTFVSKDGAHVASITDASVIFRTEEDIYHA